MESNVVVCLCSICKDSIVTGPDTSSYDDASVTKCGHVYHSRCLKKWRTLSPNCPMCRTPVDDNLTIKMLFTRSRHLSNDDDLEEHLEAELEVIKTEIEADAQIEGHPADKGDQSSSSSDQPPPTQ